jgi:NADH:ubiquinone oxidoreductase subunit 4 (subunit M)
LAVLSLVGTPASIGFAGLYPVLGSLFAFEWLGALLAMIAGLIVAWSLFWMLERVVFSPPADDDATPGVPLETAPSSDFRRAELSSDFRRAELWLIAPLVAGIVFVGLRPQAVVDLIDVSTRIASFTP